MCSHNTAKDASLSLTDLFSNFFAKYPEILNQKAFAIATSGGPDSMALAGAIMAWGAAYAPDKALHFISVNHGLRREARQEVEGVAAWVAAQKNPNLHHVILNWVGDKPPSALMEEARKARYELMAQYCAAHSITTLFLGHHQGDQGETFLIRLSKGSGLDGLAAMAPLQKFSHDIQLARPFLEVAKDDLIAYCTAQNIPFVDDPSNINAAYLRPRLRESMAILAGEGLSEKRLSVTAKRLRRARAALEEIAGHYDARAMRQETASMVEFDFEALKSAPPEIFLRVIQRGLDKIRQAQTPPPEYPVRMERLEDLCESLQATPDLFKPRTLGGAIFEVKFDKATSKRALYIKKEGA